MPKLLFISDVVGKPGRQALARVLPQWKEKYSPDAVIVNVENLAHGKGVTPGTLAEIDNLGVDCFTGGNHIFNKDAAACFEQYPKLIRPANFPDNLPGHGYYRFSKEIQLSSPKTLSVPSNGASPPEGEKNKMLRSTQQFLILNLNGQVFMEKQFDGTIANPFLTTDKLILEQGQKGDIIIVDFHAEATSEKIALGLYLDGRITAMFGTHTHVPTADARVLSGGTAYISDVGMTGARDGVLGVKYDNVIKKFLDPKQKFKNEPEEDGVRQINGVLAEVNKNQKAIKIEKLYQEI